MQDSKLFSLLFFASHSSTRGPESSKSVRGEDAAILG